MPNSVEGLDVSGPFAGRGATLQVQSILYNNRARDVAMAAASLARAADFVIASGDLASVAMVYGDCSPEPCLSGEFLSDMRRDNPELAEIAYRHFGANLGSARGHNRLIEGCEADFILVMNPDVRVAPRTLQELLSPFGRPGVGMTEARQLPIEHPKDYDPATGETSWASTACAMVPRAVVDSLGGFDADTFFLYCDDVDFSWRVRLLGLRVIHQPSAVVFHDKRLSSAGGWMPSWAERYYSAEASLLMAHKWSRPDILARYLDHFETSEEEHLRQAASEFRRRKEAGALPEPLDPRGEVAQFVGHNYAKHRFDL